MRRLALCLFALLLGFHPAAAHAQGVAAEQPVTFALTLWDSWEAATQAVPGWIADHGVMTPLEREDAALVPDVLYYLGSEQVVLHPAPVAEGSFQGDSFQARRIMVRLGQGFATSAPVATGDAAQHSYLHGGDMGSSMIWQYADDMARFLAGQAPGAYTSVEVWDTVLLQSGDLDGDGNLELLYEVDYSLKGPEWPGGAIETTYVLLSGSGEEYDVVFDTLTEYLQSGCPSSLFGYRAETLGMADFDADGALEIAFTGICYEASLMFTIYELQDGQLLPMLTSPWYGGS